MVVIIIFFPWQSFVHLDLPILKWGISWGVHHFGLVVKVILLMALLFKDIDVSVQKWAFCAAWGLGLIADRVIGRGGDGNA